jgi:hypothetical protein
LNGGYPSPIEWSGGRFAPGMPMPSVTFDMSCLGCCAGCCSDIPSSIEAQVSSLGDCCDSTRIVGLSKTSDFVWSGSSLALDQFCSTLDVTFSCSGTTPMIQITLRIRGNFGSCDASFDSGSIEGNCGEPWGYAEFENGDAACCNGGAGSVIDVEILDL